MFNDLKSKLQRTINSAGWGRVHVTACVLALGCLAGTAQAELRVSYPGFSGVWGTAAGQSTAAKLWVREATDRSLTIGGFDDRSTFSATCVLVDAARAVCNGTGLTNNAIGDAPLAPHRFLYTSELRLEADTLKEAWEIRIMLTPEEVKRVGKVDTPTHKGVLVYENGREPSRSR